ncbi:MAG: alanine:cation symporter family protein [Alphaproteobacteria bacterium]|nr:alanine:cation symporter family protein [Alphaproteobacteria bacterium]
MSIDTQIDAFFAPISSAAFEVVLYSVPILGQDVKLLLVLMLSAALFFTFYLGFVNFKYFRHGIDVALGKYDDPKDDGRINSFQALMASLSGTVGLGNIAGVAAAVTTGGAGAVFWMIMMGVLGMSTKFAEVTLGVKYRVHGSKKHPGKISGGPMYYLRDGFAKRGFPLWGKVLGIFFAVCCIAGSIGGGNMFQANQLYQQALNVTGGEAGFLAGNAWIFGVALSALVGVVIIGGIRSIANVASKIVPAMGVIYVGAGLVVLLMNYQAVPGAFSSIISEAFTLKAGLGGLLGGLLVGVQRAAFSNEAGLGTAPVVYAAARAKHPVSQGMASMIGPFLDTVVVCTMTALVILTSGVYTQGDALAGVELTSAAFATGLSWFPYVLTLAVFLFAYSTLITFSYYGVKCLTFIFGENDRLETGFKIFYLLCTIVGCAAQFSSMIDFTDAMFLSMAFPNIIGLYVFAPEIKAELGDYLKKMKL